MPTGNARRGGALAAVLIGIAALMALAVAVAIGAGVYISRHITVREARGQTVVETPFGSLRVRQDADFNPSRFGVPVYPGALREEDSRKLASFELDLGDTHKELSIVAAAYTTADPPDRVLAYYRGKLPDWEFRAKKRGAAHFVIDEDGHKRFVVIRAQHGRTHIGLASVGGPASN